MIQIPLIINNKIFLKSFIFILMKKAIYIFDSYIHILECLIVTFKVNNVMVKEFLILIFVFTFVFQEYIIIFIIIYYKYVILNHIDPLKAAVRLPNFEVNFITERDRKIYYMFCKLKIIKNFNVNIYK